jgi:spore coat polysaccharide biosynthesis protein SpsF
MRVIAILQARMSSTRLSKKVLKPILGKPMLTLQIERLNRARELDNLVVATSEGADDDAIEDLCRTLDVDCFRGSIDDLLDRYYRAAKPWNPEHVVRLTGDCPLTDPRLIDAVIALHQKGEFDYTSNVSPPSWPDGLDVEVMRFACLEKAAKKARLPSEREHITFYFTKRPDEFRLGNLEGERNLTHLRWTVDQAEDFELINEIYEELYPDNPEFTTEDILSLLDARPELSTLNAGVMRNKGHLKSFEADKEFLGKTENP